MFIQPLPFGMQHESLQLKVKLIWNSTFITRIARYECKVVTSRAIFPCVHSVILHVASINDCFCKFACLLCVFFDNDCACAPEWETIEICGFYLCWAIIIPSMAASTCESITDHQATLFSNRSAQFSFPSHCFCHFKFIYSLSNSYLILFVISISVLPIHAYLSRLCFVLVLWATVIINALCILSILLFIFFFIYICSEVLNVH